MIAVALIIVLALSLLVVRVATVALALTGLSEELARFQTQSAFFGVGFTTKESEAIASHPVRRRIISAVMILGHAVFATAVTALILSFIDKQNVLARLFYIAAGVLILWIIFTSEWINRKLSRLISLALKRWTTQGAMKQMLKHMQTKVVSGQPLHVAIMHADAPETADSLKKQVLSRFRCAELFVTEFTPVMGVHTGPGLFGVSFYSGD